MALDPLRRAKASDVRRTGERARARLGWVAKNFREGRRKRLRILRRDEPSTRGVDKIGDAAYGSSDNRNLRMHRL